MSKEGKLFPELRFAEFENEGEWENDKVENLVSTIAPPKKLQTSNYLAKGKFPIIDQSQNLYCGYTDDNEAIISDYLPLIIFGDHTCILKMAREPFAQGADGIKILKPKTILTPEFLFQFLQFNNVHQEDYKRHYSILKEKKVIYPEIKTGEQQKIASCLSTLDEVIADHSQRLELLKDHKKGLMQNLFPQEGETVPRWRFPEFENLGEWENDKVENLVSTIAPPKKLPTSNYLAKGKFPIIDQSQNFYCGYTDDNEAIIWDYLPLIIFGDHTCILKMAREPFAQGADGIKILKPKTILTPEFLFQFLQFNNVHQEDYKRHYSILKEKKVIYPEIKTGEQQKIASCLSSLDALIAAQSEKVAQLKWHKKGLMQGLFPKLS